jgi:hypothetical protein
MGKQVATATTPAPGVRSSAFRRLRWSWAVSLAGDGVRALALPLYVALRTHDPLASAAVTAAEVLPWLLLALPAGALADRTDPRRLLTLAHGLRGLLGAGLVVALAVGPAGPGQLALLCGFAFALTALETLAYPATQVLMVRLAGPDQLAAANASFFTAHTTMVNLAGPLAGGALVTISPELAFGLDSSTFLLAAVLVATLRVPSAGKPAEPGNRARGSVRDGLRALAAVAGLRVLVLAVGAGALAISAFNAMLPLYAVRALGMPAALVPVPLVVLALAALAGTRLAPRLARRWSDGPVLAVALGTMGAGILLVGAAAAAAGGPAGGWRVAVAAAGTGVLGLGNGCWNVLSAARRQRLCPPGTLGSVSGAYRVVTWGLLPIGAAISGPVAVATSLGTVFVLAGGSVLAVAGLLGRALVRTGVPVGRSTRPGDAS